MTVPLDDEQFTVEQFGSWQLGDVLDAVKTALAQDVSVDTARCLRDAAAQLARAGALPLPPFAAALMDKLLAELTEPVAQYQTLLTQYARRCPAESIQLETLNDALNDIRSDAAGNRIILQLQASNLYSGAMRNGGDWCGRGRCISRRNSAAPPPPIFSDQKAISFSIRCQQKRRKPICWRCLTAINRASVNRCRWRVTPVLPRSPPTPGAVLIW
ncbi:hypothetical protein CXB77_14765 [Chromatium okenii]|uniref:RecC C-terminal domain-containing protein n=1 Tax=Chromatium okenii TaxID=61644 RepID=A0A2S7XP05_9GAMM|nr:hypothetical protein CXB77_14765 [Chromatium okenii]